MAAITYIFSAGIFALYAVIIGIAVWARLSLARKSGGRRIASRKVQGNVEQSHIRSSRTGTEL